MVSAARLLGEPPTAAIAYGLSTEDFFTKCQLVNRQSCQASTNRDFRGGDHAAIRAAFASLEAMSLRTWKSTECARSTNNITYDSKNVQTAWWVDITVDCKHYRKKSPGNSRAGALASEGPLRHASPPRRAVDRYPNLQDLTFGQFAWRWRADATYRPPNLVAWAKERGVEPAVLNCAVRATDLELGVP